MKNPSEEIVVDFSKFLKKIHEIEASKAKIVLTPPNPNEETPQRMYAKKYDESYVNRIFIGRR